MDNRYRMIQSASMPNGHCEQVIACLNDIRQIQKAKSQASEELTTSLKDDMTLSIFGSNAIEKVGGSLKVTYRLCKRIFEGDIPDVDALDESDSEQAEELEALAASGRGTERSTVIRSRQEIVQHALAMIYLIDAIVIKEEPLQESIIKEAHRILMKFSDHEDVGGVYRTSDEAASHGLCLETDAEYEKRVKDAKRLKPNRPLPERKTRPLLFSKFVRGAAIPIYMECIVDVYNRDVRKAAAGGRLDPIDLAAKYCTFFACIHPFEDGNGRICRLLMNAILLKYTGVCVSIGVNPEERETYIEMAWRANQQFTREDRDDVPLEEHTSHLPLWGMILQKVSSGLRKTSDRLRSK